MITCTHVSFGASEMRKSPNGYCCWGAVMGRDCTCWKETYEPRAQRKPVAGPVEPRPKSCDDCAFRAQSNETRDGELDHIRGSALQSFWCHDGMRREVRLTHPDGTVREFGTGWDASYAPSYAALDGSSVAVPRRSNGKPAAICAGWWATLDGDQRRSFMEMVTG
jgi:hypothetical protein